jgi:hypothetical protein
LHPIGCFIGIGGGGGGNRGVYSRRRSSLGVDGGVLVHLIFVIRITEDDHFAVVGRPENVAVEVAEELPGELSSREVSAKKSSSPEGEARSTIGTGSEGPSCSHGGKQRRRDEVSGGDCIGGGDLDKDGGGVEALLGEEDPSLEGERGRLRFFLSSMDLKRRERRTLSTGYRCARWIAAQDDEDIYSLRSIAEQQ